MFSKEQFYTVEHLPWVFIGASLSKYYCNIQVPFFYCFLLLHTAGAGHQPTALWVESYG